MIILNPNRKLFTISVFYVEEEVERGFPIFHFIHNEDDMKKWGDKVENVITSWTSLSWGEHNIIYQRAMSQGFFNPSIHRDMKLRLALKRIKINDKTTEVTDDIINNLVPAVADEFLRLYDLRSEPSQDDLSNLGKDMKKYFEGKKVKIIPQYVYEHILAYTYKWNLEYIRSLDYYDFNAHLRMCLTREEIEKEFSIALVGGGSKKSKSSMPVKAGSKTVTKRFDPNVGTFV